MKYLLPLLIALLLGACGGGGGGSSSPSGGGATATGGLAGSGTGTGTGTETGEAGTGGRSASRTGGTGTDIGGTDTGTGTGANTEETGEAGTGGTNEDADTEETADTGGTDEDGETEDTTSTGEVCEPTPGSRFPPSCMFKDICKNPRNTEEYMDTLNTEDGTDTWRIENSWLRSWTDETYLWYDDVEHDKYPLENYINRHPTAYFAKLRTFEKDPQGQKDIDSFHFHEPTTRRDARSNTNASLGYGLRLSGTTVLNVLQGSPAAKAGITRGTVFLTNTGALHSPPAGVAQQFMVRGRDGTTRTVTMTPAEVEEASVPITRVLATSSGNVGYMLFDKFNHPAQGELSAAIETLKAAGVSDLVLDLRYNRGGFLYITSQLAYMIAGPDRTVDPATMQPRLFLTVKQNDKRSDWQEPYRGITYAPPPHYTPGPPLPNLDLPQPRLFVITRDMSCSASEAIINGLRGLGGFEVIQIGETTCGKPYGFVAEDNCGTSYYTIQLQVVNGDGFGDYQYGFRPQAPAGSHSVSMPGCYVTGTDLAHDLGDPGERYLKTALHYRDNNACPPPPMAALARHPGAGPLGSPPPLDSEPGLEVEEPDIPGLIIDPPGP